MKKRIIIGITFLFTTTLSHAQKYDNVWLWGYFPQYQDSFWWTGNGRIDFMPDTFVLSANNYNDAFRYGCAFYSDANGSLELYSNGMWLRDTTRQKIMNGDSLNYGQIWEMWEQNAIDGIGGYPYPRSTFFIPAPLDSSKAYVIQHIGENLQNTLSDTIAFSKVSKLSGEWVAVQKNAPFQNEHAPAFSTLAACKHGNGRDWWIFYTSIVNKCIQKFLLTPDGITFQSEHCPSDTVGLFFGYKSCFSPDGKLFAQGFYDGVGTRIYDFDRCNGELSNPRKITSTYITDTSTNTAIDYFRGMEFSPDGSYLYTSMGNFIFQYDLTYDSLDASRDTIATVYDTWLVDTVNGGEVYYGFYGLQTGGDGRIYVSPFYGSWHLSYINEPNKRGDTCDFRMMGLALPKWWEKGGMPYYPNYRLGRLIGSACDTVYSDVKPIYKETPWLKVYPNPANDHVKLDYNWVEWEKYKEVRCEILDMRGTAVMQMQVPRYSSWQTVSVKGLVSGVYTVALQDGEKRIAVCKLVKVE